MNHKVRRVSDIFGGGMESHFFQVMRITAGNNSWVKNIFQMLK